MRKLLLTPRIPLVHQGLLYIAAAAQAATGVLLHGDCLLSDHGHWTVTPTEPNLPEFLRSLFCESSKFLAVLWRELGYEVPETRWDGRRPHVMRLVDEAAQLTWLSYVHTQAPRAGLVERVADYPGHTSHLTLLDSGILVIKKPEIYFGKDRPSELVLRYSAPPMLLDAFGSAESLIHRLRQSTAETERACRARGGTVLGAELIQAQHPWTEPRTARESGGRLIPSFMVAGRDETGRTLRIRCAEEVRGWRAAHEDARRKWAAGDHSVEFPFGTYGARVFHAANVQDVADIGDAVINRPGPLPGQTLDHAPGEGNRERDQASGDACDARRESLVQTLQQSAVADLPDPDDTLAHRILDGAAGAVDKDHQPPPSPAAQRTAAEQPEAPPDSASTEPSDTKGLKPPAPTRAPAFPPRPAAHASRRTILRGRGLPRRLKGKGPGPDPPPD